MVMIKNRLFLRRVIIRYPHCRFATTRLHHQQQQQEQPPQEFKEQPRVNQLGIQYLSNDLHKKVFPTTSTTDYLNPKSNELLEISKQHLDRNQLLGKKTQITEPITIHDFPPLVGKSLDEHFYKLGHKSSEPYLSMATNFLQGTIPKQPQLNDWKFQSGWTRYVEGKEPELVEYPLEDELVFDVEVLYKISKYSVMATCASSKAWYGWVSPVLIDISQGKPKNELDWNHLIPMNCKKKDKVIVGYNVSYDRARVLEEYNIKQTKAFYLDGMSLHVAISGICSQQRSTWSKYNKVKTVEKNEYDPESVKERSVDFAETHIPEKTTKEKFNEDLDNTFPPTQTSMNIETDPWLLKGSPNSLANVAKFHCNIDLDKDERKGFESENPQILIKRFNSLMNYCANDVIATFEVSKKLFPIFLSRVPHPVSFAALRHLGNLILPTSTKWLKYIESADTCFQKNRDEVISTLEKRANELVQFVVQKNSDLIPKYEQDPWLSQLNWTLKQAKLKKDGTLPKKVAYLTGYPEWYRDLFKSSCGKEMNLTLRTRATPLILRLKWEGYPLFWVSSQGWCFKVPYGDEEAIERLTAKNYIQPQLPEEEMDIIDSLRENGKAYVLFKVPHPDGPKSRCTLVLSKQYVRYFEDGTLTSEYEDVAKILQLNNEASYWSSNRNRINDQFVVYNQEGKTNFFDTKKESKQHKEMAIILPILATMGTVTRRATENTWLTASNAKKNRIGSELKSLVEAPEGYCFIGADVDSEELWIASLVGDSKFEIHGGTALGWMTLEGEKAEKTDLHSKTSSILGISRNDAKVFNYGRIYGAGIKFASRLLKQFNASLSDGEANEIAKKLYDSTKGMLGRSKHFGSEQGRLYYGGSESIMFNALEAIAQLDEPKTPVLGARITDALNVKNLQGNDYMTSRVNWTIQSSGVDYLHLLIISMEYLCEKYGVDARLSITVHDELRYLVKQEDKYKAALLLQISNVWTRAMFCEQLGIKEVPQSCAFFSEVDIDFVLRKEVSMDCITPSNPIAIPNGESLNILQLLEKSNQGKLLEDGLNKIKPMKLTNVKYIKRDSVISELDKGLSRASKIAKIKLECSNDSKEWKKNLYNFAKIKLREHDHDDDGDKILKEISKSIKKKEKKNGGRKLLDLNLQVEEPKIEVKQYKKVTKKTTQVAKKPIKEGKKPTQVTKKQAKEVNKPYEEVSKHYEEPTSFNFDHDKIIKSSSSSSMRQNSTRNLSSLVIPIKKSKILKSSRDLYKKDNIISISAPIKATPHRPSGISSSTTSYTTTRSSSNRIIYQRRQISTITRNIKTSEKLQRGIRLRRNKKERNYKTKNKRIRNKEFK